MSSFAAASHLSLPVVGSNVSSGLLFAVLRARFAGFLQYWLFVSMVLRVVGNIIQEWR